MVDRPTVPTECPVCHSSRVARILYGLPYFTPELNKELDEGRTVLGGCCVFGDDPEWQCVVCRHEWGRMAWPSPPTENQEEPGAAPEGGGQR